MDRGLDEIAGAGADWISRKSRMIHTCVPLADWPVRRKGNRLLKISDKGIQRKGFLPLTEKEISPSPCPDFGLQLVF